MGLIEAINVGKQGLMAHSKRVEIHAKNIANIDTPNYVRKIPVLYATEDVSFNNVLNNAKNEVFASGTMPYISGGVTFNGVVDDPTPSELVYRPGHPDADENGNVRLSNVNPLVDMADATMSSRAYEASMAIISITKTMAQKAQDMGRQ